MMRKYLTIGALILGFACLASADVMVLNTGKKIRIKSFTLVEGGKLEVLINDRSEMVIPVEWVKEIRDEPDPPPAPMVVQEKEVLRQPTIHFAYVDHVRSASEKYELDWRLITAVMKVESNFNPRAVSRKGALGLMQLMPDTAKLYSVKNPYDPGQNIDAGVKHLKKLMKRYNNKLDLVLAAYNSGEKTVDHYQGIPPYAETRQYVKKVLNFYRQGL
ncbi:lytic transglycosylase domain-containing protein [bacterium]|nr:lytic transglycosylase domain-containing protein [bacterium]